MVTGAPGAGRNHELVELANGRSWCVSTLRSYHADFLSSLKFLGVS